MQGRVDILGLFSTNEDWEDVNSTDAAYLLLPYTQSLVMQRQRATRRLGRLRVIAQAEALMKTFTKTTDSLGIIPDDERKLFGKKGRSFILPIGDAGKKRELKIKQYQREKEMKEILQVSFPASYLTRPFSNSYWMAMQRLSKFVTDPR